MKLSKLLSAAMVCASACATLGQASSQHSWVGVWNGTLDGQPGVILTLADDRGQLGGTIVFNIVIRQPQPHVRATDPLMVQQPEINGDTLSFQITRNDGKVFHIALRKLDSRHVAFGCPECGGGPMAALVKFEP